MISLVPPVIAFTLLLSFTLIADRDRADTAISGELARDLIRHHDHHFRVAEASGFQLGVVDVALPYPLEPLAAWRSEVVQEGGRRVLLTWADGYGSDNFSRSAYRAVVNELPSRIGTGGVTGVIVFPGTGGARLGEVDIPLTASPIPAGAPAILRPGG